MDSLVNAGAKFAWFFHYMPVGNEAVEELLPTPEQREIMYHKIRAYRQTKPIFTIDFQHDGEFVGGCIAGGRSYLHINANGDIEPCAFIHYADSNIRQHTLLEAYKRPLFMAYKEGQPFNQNMLRPCPMLKQACQDLTLETTKATSWEAVKLYPEHMSNWEPNPNIRISCWYGEKEMNMKKTIKHLKRAFSNLQVHPFKGLGHGEIMTKPELLIQEVKAFMGW